MCGIAGLLHAGKSAPHLDALVRKMAISLRHRGPDDLGAWAKDGVALGHARLSILDLSPCGHQPMHSAAGRYTLVYNGEIYNAAELRDELPYPYRGHSDTEVLLAAFDAWGVIPALARLRGMFAFGVWDASSRSLTLARDRLGMKPLYYGTVGGAFAFASELKALKTLPGWSGTVDPAARLEFLRHGCIGGGRCIYRGLHKLPPAHTLTIPFDAEPHEAAVAPLPAPQRYWTLPTDKLSITDEEAVAETGRLLTLAVSEHLASDVPLGAFLSGGVDSPLIVATIRELGVRARTFTLGFTEPEYDESAAARVIAAHLGADHTELIVKPESLRELIPELPRVYDEPFADASQLPTLLVSRLAREHVTVALSGDGGDELFCGYNRHISAPRLWQRASRLPLGVRRALAGAAQTVPLHVWSSFQSLLRPLLPDKLRHRDVADTLYKLCHTLSATDIPTLYASLRAFSQSPSSLLSGEALRAASQASCPPFNFSTSGLPLPSSADAAADWMRREDLCSYLPDDVLTKLDRASMACSLEARSPYLDHRLVEFALRLPVSLCLRNGQGKWPLRKLLARHLPPGTGIARKSGFGIPVGHWLRTDLRGWAESRLSPPALESSGFSAQAVQALWQEHLTRRRDHTATLWSILVYQHWINAR